jgi:hypothetical protein
MSILRRLFGSKPEHVDPPSHGDEEEVVPVPIPALVALLLRAEQLKGSQLAEEEVIRIRDGAVCMTMTVEMKMQLEEKRGYSDLDPEFAWEQWQVARLELIKSEP